MARQVLENGVILPAEYSDDWYDDMTSNLTKLDDVIGSDSEKLSSADVGAAALSNNYNDLDNLPTIPTVNDATLTIQKNGVDVQTFTANASSNVTANITVPTKTSDLTNDSNFVDTSNSAVSSGITSAKVTDYDTHIADTDKHVTTADKSKWNNGVSQSYVLRYSSSSVTDNSTIAYSTLDNTDNIKLGDKVIDVNGKIFSVVSVDTTNQTVTVGSALIDLALDANVVHTSGNETITGTKTFENVNIQLKSTSAEYSVSGGYKSVSFYDKNLLELSRTRLGVYSSGLSYIKQTILGYDSNNQQVDATITFSWSSLTKPFLRPDSDNLVSLGTNGNKWKDVQTNLVNGLTPSSLSMPDIANKIDISSYITDLTGVGNEYTPTVNGWISIRSGDAYKISILDNVTSIGNTVVSNTATYLTVMTPVIANRKVYINIMCTSLSHAYFIPCQGNV